MMQSSSLQSLTQDSAPRDSGGRMDTMGARSRPATPDGGPGGPPGVSHSATMPSPLQPPEAPDVDPAATWAGARGPSNMYGNVPPSPMTRAGFNPSGYAKGDGPSGAQRPPSRDTSVINRLVAAGGGAMSGGPGSLLSRSKSAGPPPIRRATTGNKNRGRSRGSTASSRRAPWGSSAMHPSASLDSLGSGRGRVVRGSTRRLDEVSKYVCVC